MSDLSKSIEKWCERVTWDKLPTNVEFQKVFPGARRSGQMQEYHGYEFEHRELYTKQSFTPLTVEFVKDLVGWLGGRSVLEVAGGVGHLSYWLRKGGIEITCTDNKTWVPFMTYRPSVEELGAVEAVKKYSNVDVVLLSWPLYDEPLAHDVWQAMKPGQILLYIGEGWGGCTGDDKFHEVIGTEMEISESLNINKLTFSGLHDWVSLYKKRGNNE